MDDQGVRFLMEESSVPAVLSPPELDMVGQ